MTAPAAAFALTAALAWLGLRRFHRPAADVLAIPAAAVIWAVAIALIITWI
ncbi:hypothetical protein [Kitasatospora griseola]|uniref:hypothetical protein n=1 Tax=Kitasatospora griseola TaxID=2064 RepID=UPI000A79C452|nr:hypothetical protein [Kitasatospora griseola]